MAIVGRPVLLVGYDEDGRAELHFDDPFDIRTEDSSHTHSIWVAPEFIEHIRRDRHGGSTPVMPPHSTAASTAGCPAPQPQQFDTKVDIINN